MKLVSLLLIGMPIFAQSIFNPPIAARETRSLRTSIVEPTPDSVYQLAGGASVDLLNISGAGTLDRIQLALVTNTTTAEGAKALYDTRIQIFVNGSTTGQKVLDCDLGTFFLTHGNNDGTVSLWSTENMAVTHATQSADFGAFRRIEVQYATSVIVRIVNGSASAQARIYSQVDYLAGTPPAGLYPSTRAVFHSVATAFTNVTSLSSITLLPTVSGAGSLDSIQMVVFGVAATPTWLEGNPVVGYDSTSLSAGGTEDFFGGQFYWDQALTRTAEYGVAKAGAIQSGNFLTSFYRFFRRSPLTFSSSLSFAWSNGQTGQAGGAPPTVTVSCLVIYYTTT